MVVNKYSLIQDLDRLVELTRGVLPVARMMKLGTMVFPRYRVLSRRVPEAVGYQCHTSEVDSFVRTTC